MNTATIVQKLWNYCNVLRDDGMSYGDYVEQLTYLLFLKMADERSRPPYNQPSPVPAGYDCLPSPRPRSAPRPFACTRMALRQRKAVLCETLPRPRGRGGFLFGGDELFDHYRHTQEELGKQKGLLGLIFGKSQNNFDSRRFMAALTLRAPVGVQSPVEIVRTRPSCGGCTPIHVSNT